MWIRYLQTCRPKSCMDIASVKQDHVSQLLCWQPDVPSDMFHKTLIITLKHWILTKWVLTGFSFQRRLHYCNRVSPNNKPIPFGMDKKQPIYGRIGMVYYWICHIIHQQTVVQTPLTSFRELSLCRGSSFDRHPIPGDGPNSLAGVKFPAPF